MNKFSSCCLAGIACLPGLGAFAADPHSDEAREKPRARPAFTAASRAAVKVEDRKVEKPKARAAKHQAGSQPQGGSGPVSPGPKE